MNKSIFFRCAALLLVAILCLGLLIGCKNDKSDGKDSGSASDVTETGGESVTEAVDVLEGVTYNGEVIKVFSWIPSNLKEYVPEFEAGAHVVEQKTFERMQKTKKQLNIGVDWMEKPGNAANLADFINEAAIGIMVGDYDVICCYSQGAASLTSNGYASNLLDYGTMDFSQEWYPQNLVNDCTIFDKLYFCTGDVSTNLVNMTSMVFFNHQLMEKYKINDAIRNTYDEEDIYDLVRNGKWTQEALITLSKGVWEDNDNSSGTTFLDTVGFSTYNTLLCNFYYGAGYKAINVGEEGVSLSEDYVNAGLVVELLDTIGGFVHETNSSYYCSSYNEAMDIFADGRSLFSLAPASHAYMKHAKSNVEFGALPVPKGSVDQLEYRSVHSRPYSMYLIPNTSEKSEIAASFLQCLGQWSYTTTRTAIIETTMKGRYSSVTAEDAEMWDYIIDSQVFDMGRVFESMYMHTNGRANTDLFAFRLSQNNTDWASIIEKYKTPMIEQCTEINNMLKAFG